MANIEDTFMEKLEIPNSIGLNTEDKNVLIKLTETVEQLRKQYQIEESRLQEIEKLLRQQSMAKTETLIFGNEEIEKVRRETILKEEANKRFLEDVVQSGTDQVKTNITEKFSSLEMKISMLRNMSEREAVNKTTKEIEKEMKNLQKGVYKQLRGTKVMIGVAIWISLLNLAVIIANILKFI